MKKIYLNLAVAFVAGLFLFGCSDEGNIIEKVSSPDVSMEQTRIISDVEMTQAEEDAAFQELFVQLDSLNAEYAAMPHLQTRGFNTWWRRISNVVAYDVVGGLVWGGLGSFFSPLGTVIGGIAGAIGSSITGGLAQDSDGRLFPQKFGWPSSNAVYLSSFNSVSMSDKTGGVHNSVVEQLYTRYGKDGLRNMNENQLVGAVINQLVANGYRLPENYSSIKVANIASQIKAISQAKDYKSALYNIQNSNPGLKNECSFLNRYLDGMANINEATLLNWNVDFRNTVITSNVSEESKTNLCAYVSVGYGSANLWEIQE